MINFDDVTGENTMAHSLNMLYIPDRPFRIWKNENITQPAKAKMMMIMTLLIKFIYMLRIEMEQNIDILLENIKKLILNTVDIEGLLLNIQIM